MQLPEHFSMDASRPPGQPHTWHRRKLPLTWQMMMIRRSARRRLVPTLVRSRRHRRQEVSSQEDPGDTMACCLLVKTGDKMYLQLHITTHRKYMKAMTCSR